MLRSLYRYTYGVTILILAATTAIAQEKPSPQEQQEMMAKMMELGQPGPEHERLTQLVGEWSTDVKMWMNADGSPMIIGGSASIDTILGGRFIEGTFVTEGSMMDGEGLFIMGFDRRHETYSYVGFDSWGTYSVAASGEYDEATETITVSGTDEDPIVGFTQVYDMTLTFIDDDTWKFEVIMKGAEAIYGADPFTMVEVIYTRKK